MATAELRKQLTIISRLAVAFMFGEALTVLCLGFRWFNVGTFTAICLIMFLLSGGLVLLAVNRLVDEQGTLS
ncbi:hypothetical protein [Streptosporangium sp. NPDC002721]|uniref:hypothetical protein n=1 Tax=Streptosporangium sp. NPDC002721 TaxID=3366188 RepID=UPI0036A9FEE5